MHRIFLRRVFQGEGEKSSEHACPFPASRRLFDVYFGQAQVVGGQDYSLIKRKMLLIKPWPTNDEGQLERLARNP